MYTLVIRKESGLSRQIRWCHLRRLLYSQLIALLPNPAGEAGSCLLKEPKLPGCCLSVYLLNYRRELPQLFFIHTNGRMVFITDTIK